MPRLPADPEGFIRANTALEAPAMVPEFRLWLASEYVPIWQATEAWLEEQNVDPPYWALSARQPDFGRRPARHRFCRRLRRFRHGRGPRGSCLGAG
jgi:predicted nicotinamide N-methyase